MSNTITIELCAEDRARLDRLAEALERKTCDKCVSSALEVLGQRPAAETDPIQQKLADTLAKAETPTEAPKNAAGEVKAETAPTDHPVDEELPWKEDTQPEGVKPTVTLEQIQRKVTLLAAADAGKKKARVREIVNAYAKKVSLLPEDKWTEVWDKLTALEKEV